MAKFTLPQLPYEYNALEPHISEKTMKLHHDKHHQAYCDKFNAALEAENNQSNEIKEIFANVKDKPALRNNGGGYWNHIFFFESLGPKSKEKPQGPLLEAIENSFGSFDKFKEEFTNNAITLFGSGWTWLGVSKDRTLIIYNTSNQDNFMMDICPHKEIPLLALDVWEHAYYVDYENRRPEYITNFFNAINWDKIEQRFNEITNN